MARRRDGQLSCFRADFYDSLTGRADALFELADALLCTDGPVKTLVGLALAPEHRRGHGALYGALNQGRIEVARLRRVLASVPLPRRPTAVWSWPWTSHRGCGTTPPPAMPARSAIPTAAARTST
jgi:hypothetical protein